MHDNDWELHPFLPYPENNKILQRIKRVSEMTTPSNLVLDLQGKRFQTLKKFWSLEGKTD